ncbi:MAG: endonuclease/exonuclease/phosphatase family protein, partial [Ignavibacteriae bacterium]|nr:endonuclease/exonuclease/phosphatase family protein [Ignavibacteriota bacterium]
IFEGKFRTFHSVVNENFKGVSLIINRRQLGSGFKKVCDIPGKAIAIKYKINGLSALIIGVYAPAQTALRPGFFNELGLKLGKGTGNFDFVICLGDFNCVENKFVDRTSSQNSGSDDAGTKDFRVIKNLLRLKDVYREQNPDGREFSFFSKQHKTQSRIDRIYCNQTLLDCAQSTGFRTLGFSDHRLVSADFILAPLMEPRGQSYWKFNTLLLKDDAFIKTIRAKIKEENLLQLSSDVLLSQWERFKLDIKQFSIAFSKRRALERKIKYLDLEEKLRKAKEVAQKEPENRINHEYLKDI